MMEKITSLQNLQIKNLVKLHKASGRLEKGLFLIEGLKEINLAIKSGYEPLSLFWCPKLGIDEKVVCQLLKHNIQAVEISREAFEKVAYRDSSDGLICVFKIRKSLLNDIKLSKNPFVLLLESVEKPGNLGAILRTADAAAVDAVIVCDPRTDLFNPNVIRSGIGTLFTNQVVACTNEEAYKWLVEHKITTFAAAISPQSKPYQKFDYSKPTAIILGAEADGLSGFWLKNSNQQIIIPMYGKIDSLNVSVSAAILAFEVVRQRKTV